MKLKLKTKMSMWQFLALCYIAIILLGSLLLILPFATKGNQSTSYINALFTSVSATCVTGLVPYDTNTHWSIFGQIVIIFLIQTGGLGFMSIVSVLFILVGRNMGLYEKKSLMQSVGGMTLSGIRPLLRKIFIGTIIFEGIGAILLSIRFIPAFGFLKGCYYSVWHSISAFCNAGFDLMGGTFSDETFVSFTNYAKDPLVCLTLSSLIIIGGLGFCVWSDIHENKLHFRKYQLNTKIVIVVNAVLLTASTILFLLFEKNGTIYDGFTMPQKWLASFFNATSPRTAGFNIVDLSNITNSSFILSIILMFIGGSSGSTAGGIKVTTFAVIIMGMISVFRNRKDIEIGNKRVDYSLVNQALAIFAACLMTIALAALAICAIEPAASFKAVLFETVSAMGTVGLSLSLTPTLSVASKLIIIVLMYAGRVGILTLALALGESRKSNEIRKPVDTFLIG